jgi:hypothetical protein
MAAASNSIGSRPEVRTPADVRRVLATEMERVAANPDLDPIGKAQALAELGRVALRAMQLGNLDARMESIESVLRHRKDTRVKEPKGRAKEPKT